VGDTIGNDYAVLDGIKPGDHIITSGLQFLQDGAPVAEQIQSTDSGTDKSSAVGGGATR
jgi:cell shape-determining protein MreC